MVVGIIIRSSVQCTEVLWTLLTGFNTKNLDLKHEWILQAFVAQMDVMCDVCQAATSMLKSIEGR